MTKKRCPRCKETKPTSAFNANRRKTNGRCVYCRECAHALDKGYRMESPETYRAYLAKSRAKRRTKAKVERRLYYLAHREALIASEKARAQRKRPEKLEYYRKYNARRRDSGKERIRSRVKYYRDIEKGRDLSRQASARRRARQRNAQGVYSTQSFYAKCEQFGWLCFYCGCELTKRTVHEEHMTPLSRGGRHELVNVVPACRQCNSRKCAMTAEEFMARRALPATP